MKKLLFVLFTTILFGCEAKMPEFAGVYVLEGNKYIDVPKVNNFKKEKFNHKQRLYGTVDFNVKTVLNKEQFVPVNQDAINKQGFLVVQNKYGLNGWFKHCEVAGISKNGN